MQFERRHTVIAVVSLNHVFHLGREGPVVLARDGRFDGPQLPRRALQIHFSHQAVKRFEFLDRVALDTCLQTPSHHAVEIHEYFSAKQNVQFVCPRCITAHEAFHRRRLIGSVVINMHPYVP